MNAKIGDGLLFYSSQIFPTLFSSSYSIFYILLHDFKNTNCQALFQSNRGQPHRYLISLCLLYFVVFNPLSTLQTPQIQSTPQTPYFFSFLLPPPHLPFATFTLFSSSQLLLSTCFFKFFHFSHFFTLRNSLYSITLHHHFSKTLKNCHFLTSAICSLTPYFTTT